MHAQNPCSPCFYILEHSGTYRLRVSLVFITQLLGYQCNFVCFVYWWFVSARSLINQAAPRLINFGCLKNIFINDLWRKGVQWLCFKCLMVKECSQANISIIIQVFTHCHMSNQVFTTRCALNTYDSIKESNSLEKKMQVSTKLLLSSTVHGWHGIMYDAIFVVTQPWLPKKHSGIYVHRRSIWSYIRRN